MHVWGYVYPQEQVFYLSEGALWAGRNGRRKWKTETPKQSNGIRVRKGHLPGAAGACGLEPRSLSFQHLGDNCSPRGHVLTVQFIMHRGGPLDGKTQTLDISELTT